MQLDIENIFQNAVDGIFILDKDQHLVLCNQACEEMYEISRQDLINTAFNKVTELGKTQKAALKDDDLNPFAELNGVKERFFLSRKNGDTVWVEANYIPVMDDKHENISYVLGILKDLSEFRELEAENENLRKELESVRENLAKEFDFSKIIGQSPELTKSLDLASKVSKESTTVILLGESGTGKELFARAIHYNSPRNGKAYVAVNCSAFPDSLIESELFGHEKGAFTGADSSRKGKVAQAEGGTLFLDEIGDLSASAQSKVLRLLQENEFQPLGSTKTLKADVRFVSATNRDLKTMVKKGDFREDLYYRIFVYPISLPALRQRKQDIPELADYFLKKMCADSSRKELLLSDGALAALMNYSWPGNIREFQNILERTMILCKGNKIEDKDLPLQTPKGILPDADLFSLNSIPEGMSLEGYKEQWERGVIEQTLNECNSNKAKTARRLGMTRSALRYKMEKYKFKD